MEINQIPTSDMIGFKKQLESPNQDMRLFSKQNSNSIKFNNNQEMTKLNKNLVISIESDFSGCGFLRNIFPMVHINSVIGKSGKLGVILTHVPIMDLNILLRCRTIWLQRFMSPESLPVVLQYKELQKKYGFKLIYELDDFIWENTSDPLECIPDYNFGKISVTSQCRETSKKIMELVDLIVVSTEFLKYYISEKLNIKTKIEVLSNAVPKYLWGNIRRRPITKKIEMPIVLSTSSPTHFSDQLRIPGDFEYWKEWIIKNVTDNKIQYYQLGGDPYFFESIKNNSHYHSFQWADSCQYPNLVKSINAHYTIGPLVPNYFNYSKSCLKYQESAMYGAVFLGAVFSEKEDKLKPSPYDVCEIKIPYFNINELDRVFWDLCNNVDFYNETIKKQYKFLDDTGGILESPKYTNNLIRLLS